MGRQARPSVGRHQGDLGTLLYAPDEQPLLYSPQLPICITDPGYPVALWTVYLFIPPTYSKKFTESGNNLSLYLEMKIHLRDATPNSQTLW